MEIPAGAKPATYVDDDLVRRARNGDKDAFEELFHRYQKRVYNIVYQIVVNETDAADLTQDVFVRVYNSLGSLKAEQAFLTWLRTVAVNVSRDYLRRKGAVRVESLEEPADPESSADADPRLTDWSTNPERLLESKDMQRTIRAAVSALPEQARTVVVLHHIEGMDVESIAKVLRWPVGTVKSRLSRARDQLRRKLAGYLAPG